MRERLEMIEAYLRVITLLLFTILAFLIGYVYAALPNPYDYYVSIYGTIGLALGYLATTERPVERLRRWTEEVVK